MAVKNLQVAHVWLLGLTGLAGTMTATLKRYPSATSEVSASETVTIVEIGATGSYYVTYTPTNAQVYSLKVYESTTDREYWWEDEVQDAPSTASLQYAYATLDDVVAVAQMGAYTSATTPTDVQVTSFLEQRAAEIFAKLVPLMRNDATGPSGYSTTVDQSTDTGKALARVLRRVNAIGAARDALQAAGATASPTPSVRVEDLDTLWRIALHGDGKDVPGEVADAAQAYLSSPRSATHLSTGQVQRATVFVRAERGLQMTDEVQF